MQPLWRAVWRLLKKLKIEFLYDLAIPLLGIYTEKTLIEKDTCTHVYSSTIYNSQDMEANYMSINRWMDKDVVYICIYICSVYMNIHIYIHTHTQWNISHEIMPLAATWMDLEISILSEVNQANIVWYHLYVESKKWYKWTYLQNRKRLIHIKKNNNLRLKGRKMGEG